MPDVRSRDGASRPTRVCSVFSRGLLAFGVAATLSLVAPAARAEEGGASFWPPGQFSSLAAVPPAPGWSLPMVYYHSSVDAGGGKNFMVGGQVRAGVEPDADLVFFGPSYTFETPVLGGRPSIGLLAAVGNMDASADATLTGPRGNVLSLNPSDSLFSGSDLYCLGSLRWNLFAEPQYTIAHEGVAPQWQFFVGLNLQFPIGH
jgi:hypothetical protein